MMNRYRVMVWNGDESRSIGWEEVFVSAKRCVVGDGGDLYLYHGEGIAAIFSRDMWRDVAYIGGEKEACCCE